MTISKPELYELIRTLHSEHKTPVPIIAEAIKKSERQVRRITADLKLKRLTSADHMKSWPVDVMALCLKARRR